jgi:hypothetical protein
MERKTLIATAQKNDDANRSFGCLLKSIYKEPRKNIKKMGTGKEENTQPPPPTLIHI